MSEDSEIMIEEQTKAGLLLNRKNMKKKFKTFAQNLIRAIASGKLFGIDH